MTDLGPVERRVVLVDGTCVFCTRLGRLILRRDRKKLFHLSQIQSEYARGALSAAGIEPDIDAIYLINERSRGGQQVLIDGAAGKEIWPRLFWFAWPLRLVPLFLLNPFYGLFARVRYRIFGQYDQCAIPTDEERARYLP